MVGYQKKDGFVLYDDFLNEEVSFLSLVNLSLPEDLLKIVSFEYSHHHISVESPTEEDFNTFMSDYFVMSPQYKSVQTCKFFSKVYKNLENFFRKNKKQFDGFRRPENYSNIKIFHAQLDYFLSNLHFSIYIMWKI